MTSHLRTFIALLLLALWLPATQHCGLEAAGMLADSAGCHEDTDCPVSHERSHCDTDNCQPVEDSAYKSAFAAIQIAAPAALSCLCCLHDITPETVLVPLVSPERTTVPPELTHTWQFIARAAPAPRAPSLVS